MYIALAKEAWGRACWMKTPQTADWNTAVDLPQVSKLQFLHMI